MDGPSTRLLEKSRIANAPGQTDSVEIVQQRDRVLAGRIERVLELHALQAVVLLDDAVGQAQSEAGAFPLVYCNGVFHHVPPAQRPAVVRLVRDSLEPGGLFALWDNNPWNPGARLVMRRIPFDRGAVMLSAREARSEAEKNLEGEQARYDAGVVVIRDLLEAQRVLTTAKSEENQALFRYRLSILRYYRASAQLLDKTRIAPVAAVVLLALTAAAPEVPRPLLDQLAEGGRLVLPVGGRGMQILQRWQRQGESFESEEGIPVAFVPLRGEYGWENGW